MHLIVNFAGEADKALRLFDATMIESGFNPKCFDRSQAGCHRLVQTAAKAFTQRGSNSCGVSAWSTCLADRYKLNKMVTFSCHSTNLLFYDGGAVYYHRDDIEEFLDSWPNPNQLLQSIKYDIKEQIYLAGLKALGIVDKLITGPLWRLITQIKTVNMPPYLKLLQKKLLLLANDASPLMEGCPIFLNIPIHKDVIYTSVFEDIPDRDSYTQAMLEHICGHFLILLERQAVEQLQGGKLAKIEVDGKFKCIQ